MGSSISKGKLCALTVGLLACSTAGAQEPATSEASQPAAEQTAPAASATADAATGTEATGSAAAASDELPEVIVTARRVEEKLQDVPISITVFNQDQLSKRNVVSATDLANFTPSLSSNNNFGNENTTFAIRGFVQDAGTAPSVGTYFADVVAPRGPTQGTTAGDGVGPGSFFDLENVQVLKGPQGTLFGRNTTGGAVLLVPKKPTSEFGGYLEDSIGNYDMHRMQGVVNAPLSNSARFRLAFDHQARDGYLNNISGVGPDAFNDVNYDAVRASLVLDLSENVENYTIASYSKSDTNGSVQKLIACNPAGADPQSQADVGTGLGNFFGVFSCGQLDREKAQGAGFYDVEGAADDPISRITQWQVINTTTWIARDDLTVKNIASYAEFTDLQRSPLFGTNWQVSDLSPAYQGIFAGGIPSLFTGIFAPPGLKSADQSTYTEEVQLQGAAFDSRLTYQAGVYLEWSDPLSKVGNQSSQLASCTDLATFQCTDPLGATFTALARMQDANAPDTNIGAVNYTVGETSYRDQGVYTQATYAITDQFKATGGLRYTWDKQTNDAVRRTTIFPVSADQGTNPITICTDPGTTANGCRNKLEEKSSKPTWMIDFDYTPVQDVLTYAKYARGYRAGGVFSNAPVDKRTFNPEKVDNYEIGFKTSFDKIVRGTFNVAAFYNNFTNQQLQIGFNARDNAPVSPTTGIVNAGKSRIYGAEVESTLVPTKGLTFQLSYTYLNTSIRSIDPVSTDDPNYEAQVSQIAKGSPLVLSPKNKLSIAGNYVLPLERSIGQVSLGLNYIYTAQQTTSYTYQNPAILAALGGTNYGVLASRNLLNGNISWDQIAGTALDLSVFATNLTGEKYYQFVPGLASLQTGLEFATLGEPRMYGLRLRYSFGDI
ncbi:TonB-dependent receptor [Solimonas terrae]|uniref:TonB-dependent receptor n=1 Tax=Solimonas terrae TaxID=1396819 RepID=A0A6M2BMP3_9GAMM|nr:TonB-dependent receptor [Solimonas terrae]NGY03922.1 TonB-dependent receptor [Solimonas terrae]